jgi:glycosyltransferase involved in cell wall biosynthesis
VRGRVGGGLAALGLHRPTAPRALFVDNFVPTPDRDAASIDMAWYLRIFADCGYETTLLPVDDLRRADGYVADLRQHGIRVVADGWAASAGDFLRRETAPFDVILIYRVSIAAGPLFDLLRAHSPQARVVFNTVDLHFLRLEREALLLRSAEKLDAAFAVQQRELAAIARADMTILLSPVEERLVANLLPRARTIVMPIAREIARHRPPFAQRHGVLFVGGFRHRPNGDAIVAFVRDIWPLVRARLATTLRIVGADAPAEVLALANDADGIVVRGHVADLEAELATCRLTVAPLRFGAGTKGKIVSSLVAGVPCVASPIAAEGMELLDGVHLRVAATDDAFADAVVALHEDAAAWTAMSEAGLAVARGQFTVDAARLRIRAMLDELGLP